MAAKEVRFNGDARDRMLRGIDTLANAVRVNRYLQGRVLNESLHAKGQERLAYRYGNHAVAWVMAKRLAKVEDA